ncbi:hypothetical protein [Anaerotalea alkaliphila]|uniref:Zinc ribbon domain-containing protein n=1 Tax=Anaerotalea alkaliphila TaxID=2662126 RepID=A0A7X5KMV2_9FIRM|nr:hypothetical protein [Anaerotalea alkaliphila]NDL67364.1 hypothetical protein [Anaerotalea alkaliphila]
MPWCPKCKTEYEEGVAQCAECAVPLVDDLKEAKYRVPLAQVADRELGERILEYLRYSKCEDALVEEGPEGYTVLVLEKDKEKATKHLRVYLQEMAREKEEEEEEEEEAGYATEHLEAEPEDGSLAYFLLGGASLAAGALLLLGVVELSFLRGRGAPLLLLAFGGLLLWVGISAKRKADRMKESGSRREAQVREMTDWFKENGDLGKMLSEAGLDLGDTDQGAAYYQLADRLKEALEQAFPQVEETLRNTAAERIQEEMVWTTKGMHDKIN